MPVSESEFEDLVKEQLEQNGGQIEAFYFESNELIKFSMKTDQNPFEGGSKNVKSIKLTGNQFKERTLSSGVYSIPDQNCSAYWIESTQIYDHYLDVSNECHISGWIGPDCPELIEAHNEGFEKAITQEAITDIENLRYLISHIEKYTPDNSAKLIESLSVVLRKVL